ncbi:MAG: tyrosine-type recombinase/integrase, partial [Planctomycetia bacterium]
MTSTTIVPVTTPANLAAPANLDELRLAHAGSFASIHTRDAYRGDLDAWEAWCDEHNAPAFPASRVVVDAWCRSMEADLDEQGRRRVSDSTLARRLGALSSLHAYAIDEGIITVNPVANVRRPKRSTVSTTQGLTRDEARRMIATADTMGERTSLLVRLLIHNGLRVSEALAMRVEDVFEQGEHLVVTVSGKGSYKAVIPLNAPTRHALEAVIGTRTTGLILQTSTGKALDRHNVAKLVSTVAERAGISKRISPHSLRHTAITAALDAGVPLRDVQDFARHADPRTTRRYDRNAANLDRHATYKL